MKKITKAVIPAAGLGTRMLPVTKAIPKEMLPLVNKPTIQYIVEEAVASGIKEILIIVSSKKEPIIDHFDYDFVLESALLEKHQDQQREELKEITKLANIYFVRQKLQNGLGDAILHASSFVCNEDFAVLLGDDVVFSKQPALAQCIQTYMETNAQVIGVQEVPTQEVNKYGIITPEKDWKNTNPVKVLGMVEKPAVQEAKSNLAILGRYILKPSIFEALKKVPIGAGGELQLTDGLNYSLQKETFYAKRFSGKRFDIGNKRGFIKANLFLALKTGAISPKEVHEILRSAELNEFEQ